MRLPYTANPPTPASEDEAAIVSRIQARRAPRPLQPLDLTLLHAPAVADGWNGFLGAVRTRTSLDAASRELAVCRVAAVNAAWYEWAHHAPLATSAGASDAAMAIVRGRADTGLADVSVAEREAAGLGGRQWAVLRYADEMTRNVAVPEDVFAALKAECSDKEVVEVTAIVAAYNCVSRFLVALDVGEKNGTGPAATGGH
ncbi:AhpD-like protein [Hypoxylon sp. FL1284]|nr:AhpD-like protein [Hypoxylon sp. FL1284]